MIKGINKGFSLIELMVVMAALGGVALLVTKLGKDSMSMQSEAAITRDYNDLVRESHFIISNLNSCKASLAGTTFSNSDLDKPLSNIELWSSNATGTARDKKRYAKSDKLGVLQIDNIHLKIAKDLPSTNEGGSNSVMGTTAMLKIILVKPKGENSLQNTVADIEQSINISYSINPSNGKKTIIDCEDLSNSKKDSAKVWCGTILNPCGPDMVASVAIGKYENGKFTGTFEPTGLGSEAKICRAAVNQPAALSSCPSAFSDSPR